MAKLNISVCMGSSCFARGNNENLEFIENSFQRGYVPEGGIELDGIMPPINPFDKSANRQGKIQKVLERIKSFFNKFFDISNGEFSE